MPALEIVDDLLAPSDYITISTRAFDPIRICAIIPEMCEAVLEIEAKDVLELVFKYDITKSPPGKTGMHWFYDILSCEKAFDRWTKAVYRFKVEGYVDPNTKIGDVTVEIKGWLYTKYEYSNFLQRAFWLFYNYTFYYKLRRKYLRIAKDYLYDLRNRIEAQLGIKRLAKA